MTHNLNQFPEASIALYGFPRVLDWNRFDENERTNKQDRTNHIIITMQALRKLSALLYGKDAVQWGVMETAG